MKSRLLILLAGLFVLVTLGFVQDAQRGQPTAKSQARIIKQVRHELLMLPYFGVFDNIAYKVDGYYRRPCSVRSYGLPSNLTPRMS